MKQDQSKVSGKSTQTVDEQLQEKFESIKSAKTQPKTRTVTLEYQSCCGCGCHTIEIERTVPFDSDLQNGDRIEYIEDNDRRV